MIVTSYFKSLVNGDSVSWFILIFLIFFLLWLFVGGGDHEYIGLAPMKIGVDSTKYIDDHVYRVIERGNYQADKVSGIDVTPKIPSRVSSDQAEGLRPSQNNFVPNFVPRSVPNFVPRSVPNFVPRSHENANGVQRHIPFSTDISPRLTPIAPMPPVCEIETPETRNKKKCSKGEQKCREALEAIYGKPFDCVRPDFLKNPETGRNLELDCYNDELKIALEYNGVQHYKWPNFTGQSKEAFTNQLRRDKYKAEVCTEHGIYLINVPYNVPHKHILSYIKYYAPENYENRLADEKNPNRIYDHVSESFDADMINYIDSEDSDSDSDGDYENEENEINEWDSEEYDEYQISYIDQ